MKKLLITLFVLLLVGLTAACNANNNKAKLNDDVVKDALKQANYDNVKVNVDNDKRVVTLSGNLPSDQDKEKAEKIAQSKAPDYVVRNEIGVRPEGAEGQARKVDSNLDDAIKADWKAAVAQNKWENQHINADVKNGVITLKGDVDTPAQREQAEKVASKLPNVQQVVNELQVKNAKRQNKSKTVASDER